jgi:hypothetical protein
VKIADISGNKQEGHLKANTDDLENDSKIKNIRDFYRDINDFRKDYQPRTNTVKDENGDLVTDSHSILARWRSHSSQLLNVHGVNDVRQMEIYNSRAISA